ncbi:hypothetical protein LCGC14_1574810 [marine sediment metagenome]|uniref:Uncharacterized protein n=1 Tax=marine sediment metagenome TaxID=412755 RepID=A0A0F9LIY7_9ZZZZ|nr:hypothetical protein [archaeon]
MTDVSFTNDAKLQLIEDTANPGTYLENDLMTLKLVQNALKDAFGSMGFILLTTGLMTFTQDVSGKYNTKFKLHKRLELGTMIYKFGVKGLYLGQTPSEKVFTGSLKTMIQQKFAKKISTYISFISSGYMQRIEYDLVQDTTSTSTARDLPMLPTNSFFTKLYTNYPNTYQSPGFYRHSRTTFLNTYLDRYLTRLKRSFIGSPAQILLGRQILVREFNKLFESDLESKFDITKQEVLSDYLEDNFLYQIYRNARYGVTTHLIVNRDYIKTIYDSLYSSSATKLRFGNIYSTNPLFTVDSQNPNSGYFLNFDPTLIDSNILQQALLTLTYFGANTDKKNQFKNEIALIENVWDKIKDPIKKTYDKLYDYLWNFQDDSGNSVNRFSVSFHKATYDGVDPEGSLLINSIPGDLRGDDLAQYSGERLDFSINWQDPAEFRRTVLSIVKYMVKYNAFIKVDVGLSGSGKHALYLSLDKFLTNDYVTTSFTGDSILGHLTNYANSLYTAEQALGENDEEKYDNIWTSDNIFPIYVFKDATDLDTWMLRYFESLANSYQTSDNRYSLGDDTLLALRK